MRRVSRRTIYVVLTCHFIYAHAEDTRAAPHDPEIATTPRPTRHAFGFVWYAHTAARADAALINLDGKSNANNPSTNWHAVRQLRPHHLQALNIRVPAPAGIAAWCDWVIGSRLLDERHAWGDPAVSPATVFVRYQYLQRFLDGVLPHITQPFVLFSGDSDCTIPRQLDTHNRFCEPRFTGSVRLASDPQLVHWYAENLDDAGFHPSVSGFPTGVNLNEFAGLDADAIIAQAMQRATLLVQRPLRVMQIDRRRPTAQFAARQRVYELCRGAWAEFCDASDAVPRLMDALSGHSFLLCVHGGGLDPSPKAWEALLTGTIPIIVPAGGVEDAYRGLPVVFVQSWNESSISLQRLQAWKTALLPHYTPGAARDAVLHRLSARYWPERARAEVSRGASFLRNSEPSNGDAPPTLAIYA